MRGRPLLEWLCFLLAWGLLAIPLWHLTLARAARPPDAEAPPAGQGAATHAWVHLRFSESPQRFTLTSNGTALWSGERPDDDMEQPLDVVWTALGPVLELEAEWAEDGRRAVEIAVAAVTGARARATVWSREALVRERLVFE